MEQSVSASFCSPLSDALVSLACTLNLSFLRSAFCLSKFTHACSLLTCLCSSVSTVRSVSDWFLSFAANTPMLFVVSGKPSGSPSAVAFLFAEILVHDRSLSFGAVFVSLLLVRIRCRLLSLTGGINNRQYLKFSLTAIHAAQQHAIVCRFGFAVCVTWLIWISYVR